MKISELLFNTILATGLCVGVLDVNADQSKLHKTASLKCFELTPEDAKTPNAQFIYYTDEGSRKLKTLQGNLVRDFGLEKIQIPITGQESKSGTEIKLSGTGNAYLWTKNVGVPGMVAMNFSAKFDVVVTDQVTNPLLVGDYAASHATGTEEQTLTTEPMVYGKIVQRDCTTDELSLLQTHK